MRAFHSVHTLLYALILVAGSLLPGQGTIPVALAAPAPPLGLSASPRAGQSATVSGTAGHGLRVRSGPGLQHRIVATAQEGAVVYVVAGPVSGGGEAWYQITLPGAGGGWSTGRYLVAGTARPTAPTASPATSGRSFVARVTAYSSGVGGVPHGARTYSGTRPRWGVVAVDPNVIPIGSALRIEGYSGATFIAEDTGSRIRGQAIDLWLPDANAARRYGVQHRRVTILREGPAR